LGGGAVASLYGWALFLSNFSHPGAIGLNLNDPGSDWMVFYSAARSFFAGRLDLIFDGEDFTPYLNTAFSAWLSKPMPYRPWVHPPTYLLLLLPFGS
jgi:alpha-1,2-mannosyltransferase